MSGIGSVLRGRLTEMFLNTLRQYHYFNEVRIVVNISFFLYSFEHDILDMLDRVSRDHQRAWNIHSVLKNHQFDTLSCSTQ